MAFKIGILISGKGSNMLNIIKACQSNKLESDVKLVISNKLKAEGIEKAKKRKIKTEVILKSDFKKKEGFEKAIDFELKKKKINLICLAGFMTILSHRFVRDWKNKIINIHPSLLPSFKGLNAQSQAYKYGVKYTGCSVHYVDEGIDSGEIIDQEVVKILEKDTIKSITRKILMKEHILYINAIKHLEKIHFYG
tara:strand:+ start:35 stop:616 length:582 start_codon:yes stop_codon:yes gene_type:complete